MHEIDSLPIGTLDTILLVRSVRHTYDAIQQAKGNPERQKLLYETPAGELLLVAEANAAKALQHTPDAN